MILFGVVGVGLNKRFNGFYLKCNEKWFGLNIIKFKIKLFKYMRNVLCWGSR